MWRVRDTLLNMTALLVMNWKMNPQTLKEAKELYRVALSARRGKRVDIIVAPPFVFLQSLAKKGGIPIAAQNVHTELSGAHTGEVSATQVFSAGASHVIIGHAERRAKGDTDEDVKKKVHTAITVGLSPIVCIGEKERDQHGDYLETIKNQLTVAMQDVPKAKLKNVIVAYEPVWAIGAEKPMTTHEMHEMTIYVKKILVALFGKGGFSVPVLYGGAIDEHYAKDMLLHGDVQGFLVGRASVDVEKEKALINACRGV